MRDHARALAVVSLRCGAAFDVIGMVRGQAAREAPRIRRPRWPHGWKVAAAGWSVCTRLKQQG
jgi:hypothetical protein